MERKIIVKINNELWMRCPKCGKKLFKLSENTELFEFPVYCRNCRESSHIIHLKGLEVEYK